MEKPNPKDFHLNITWLKDEQKYFARCAEIPCCTGYGDTIDEVVASAYEAIQDHLEYREELGLPAPGSKGNWRSNDV